jgi:NADH-quinone oxidoreductase subunit L
LQGLQLEHRYVAWAWLVGIVAAVVIYGRGLGLASSIARVTPIRWLHTWLLHKMYFDELYAFLFAGPFMLLTKVAGWFDRVVIDGVVNLAATSTERLSRMVGWHDRRVVDGAVTGVGHLAWELGAAARAPQTGRVRLYVTALMLVVVIGLAVTVGVMIWR